MSVWGSSERKALEARMKQEGRLPPGQALTSDWPVLHYDTIPEFNPATWDFRITGCVQRPMCWTWDEFLALPRAQATSDFHCVTRWSRLNNRWEGIPFRAVNDLAQPLPSATHVMIHCGDGYTTNVPLGVLLEENVLLATQHDGELLEPEHGGPLRLVVPRLYGWKSAKWVRGLEFMSEDRPGFWEQNGYHMVGDPWLEQRFDTD